MIFRIKMILDDNPKYRIIGVIYIYIYIYPLNHHPWKKMYIHIKYPNKRRIKCILMIADPITRMPTMA